MSAEVIKGGSNIVPEGLLSQAFEHLRRITGAQDVAVRLIQEKNTALVDALAELAEWQPGRIDPTYDELAY